MQKTGQGQRLFYLDNLKVLLTILVIVHHVGQAYGPTGGYWDFQSIYRVPLLGTFFTINASFFMGLFFFISAFFIPASLDRNGTGKFIKDRLLRYGIPVLFGFLVIVPVDQYFSFITWRGGPKITFIAYLTRAYFNFGEKPFNIISPSWPELNFGHLWFIQHLLVYSLIYAFISWISGKRKQVKKPGTVSRYVPGIGSILFFCVIAAYLTGLVRIFYPLDKWVPFLYFIQLEPAHMVSYVFSFVAGIWTFRYQWLSRISLKTGWILISIGFLLSLFLVWIYITQNSFLGNWFEDNRFLYETIMGMTLMFGLVIVSKVFLDKTNLVWHFMSKNAYGAYIFHVPIVVFFQYSMERKPPFVPVAKFLLVSMLSIVFSFFVSFLVRKIPGMKRILG